MLFGLINRRERWGISLRGWVVILAVFGVASWWMVTHAYSFLAVTRRVDTRILVVEGWVGQHTIRGAAKEFVAGGYDQVYATGGPVNGLGGYVNDFQTSASVGAGLLRGAGVPTDRVRMVPSRVMARDRTYSAAVALREWFRERGMEVTSFNVLTQEAHGRRSLLLNEMAFGEGVEIGVISIPNPDYDGSRWWRSSEGVREVLSETIAYLYAKLLFRPDRTTDVP